MIQFEVNGKAVSSDSADDTPLLWVIRDELKLKGTKFGCGIAQCGACTVHLNGQAVRSCVMPLASAADGKVTTIEGLQSKAGRAIQQAWRELDVAQCGYCQSGQIMQATHLLGSNATPTDKDIDAAMQGNACRCATYQRIRAAIHRAAAILAA